MSKSGLKLVLACAIAVAGCASNPATGVAASGDMLRVRYSTGTGAYVSDDVVGTDVQRDSQGNEVGSTDHVQSVEHSYRWNDWAYYQGREELDEQDYYRIAGDTQAVSKIEGIRSRASRMQKIGAPTPTTNVTTASRSTRRTSVLRDLARAPDVVTPRRRAYLERQGRCPTSRKGARGPRRRRIAAKNTCRHRGRDAGPPVGNRDGPFSVPLLRARVARWRPFA